MGLHGRFLPAPEVAVNPLEVRNNPVLHFLVALAQLLQGEASPVVVANVKMADPVLNWSRKKSAAFCCYSWCFFVATVGFLSAPLGVFLLLRLVFCCYYCFFAATIVFFAATLWFFAATLGFFAAILCFFAATGGMSGSWCAQHY